MSEQGGTAEQRAALGVRRLILDSLDSSYRLAAIILRDPVEAEDAVHDAAVAAWRAQHDLRDSSMFEAWFGRILINVCRDHLRQRGRRLREIAIDDVAALAGTADPSMASEFDALRSAIRALSPDHRIAIVLRYYLDLSVEDIAARTRTRPGTVRSRLHYGLRELRSAYEATQR